MNEFISELGTLHFWLSVILVGIVINLLANFLPVIFIKTFAIYSKQTREFNRRVKRRFVWISHNPELISVMLIDSVFWLLFGLLVLTMGIVLPLFFIFLTYTNIEPTIVKYPWLSILPLGIFEIFTMAILLYCIRMATERYIVGQYARKLWVRHQYRRKA